MLLIIIKVYTYLFIFFYWHKFFIHINSDTPLVWAIINGHVSIAKMLIEASADVFKTNNDGVSIIHYASLYGKINIMMFIYQYLKENFLLFF